VGRDLVEVRAPARLHLGLLDLGNATHRTFGGFGVMVNSPTTVVTASPANGLVFRGNVGEDDLSRLRPPLERFLEAQGRSGVSIEILSSTRPHVGLGHGTSIVLTALVAACEALDIRVDREQLQLFSRRGGASGIGVNGFFTGGLLVDSGHPVGTALLPSSAQSPTSVPPVLLQLTPPAQTIITIFSSDGDTFSGARERDLFRESTPVPRSDVLEQIALLFHGFLPAVAGGDLETAGAAYSDFCSLGFKAREIEAAGSRPRIDFLRTIAPIAGMSSIGPFLFTISSSRVTSGGRLPRGLRVVAETQVNLGGYEVACV
jgi:beta-ribofuranosylaminobenzene 5'-phosphate synthase